MKDYFGEIIKEMKAVEQDYRLIYNLAEWAHKTYWEINSKGKFENIQYTLLEYILLRLFDFAGDLLGDEIDIKNVEISKEVIANIKDSFNEIYSYLEGERSYYKVCLIQENLVDEDGGRFNEVINCSNNLKHGILLTDELENDLSRKAFTIKTFTRKDILYCECIRTLLSLNKAHKCSTNIIYSCSKYGNCENELLVEHEQDYLTSLIEVVKGDRHYRLNICINNSTILYSNLSFM